MTARAQAEAFALLLAELAIAGAEPDGKTAAVLLAHAEDSIWALLGELDEERQLDEVLARVREDLRAQVAERNSAVALGSAVVLASDGNPARTGEVTAMFLDIWAADVRWADGEMDRHPLADLRVIHVAPAWACSRCRKPFWSRKPEDGICLTCADAQPVPVIGSTVVLCSDDDPDPVKGRVILVFPDDGLADVEWEDTPVPRRYPLADLRPFPARDVPEVK